MIFSLYFLDHFRYNSYIRLRELPSTRINPQSRFDMKITNGDRNLLLEALRVVQDNTGDQDWADMIFSLRNIVSNGGDLSVDLDYKSTITCALSEARDYVGDPEWADDIASMIQRIEA
jgi:hypothetical protein